MQIDAGDPRQSRIAAHDGGDTRGSLLSVVDSSVTAAGARLLGERLASPLRCAPEIGKRLDGVEYFFEHWTLRAEIRKALAGAPDLSRSLSGSRSTAAARAISPRSDRRCRRLRALAGLKNSDGVPDEICARGASHGRAGSRPARRLAERARRRPAAFQARRRLRARGFDKPRRTRALRDEPRGVIAGCSRATPTKPASRR
jgi:DNA mismatch repair protein MutS